MAALIGLIVAGYLAHDYWDAPIGSVPTKIVIGFVFAILIGSAMTAASVVKQRDS